MTSLAIILVLLGTVFLACLCFVQFNDYQSPLFNRAYRFHRDPLTGATNIDHLETLYNFELRYRAGAEELVELADALLPQISRRTDDRLTFNNVEGLAIVLRR